VNQDRTKQKIIVNMTWNVAGTILMFFVGIVSSVIYVRYLGNEKYGVAVYITDMAILGVTICSLGLGTYQSKLLQKLRTEERYGSYKNVFFHNLRVRFLMVLAALVVILIATWALPGSNILQQNASLFFIAIFLVAQMALAVLRGPLQVEYQQKFLNLLDVSSLIMRLFLVLMVIYFDYGLIGFILSELLVELVQFYLLGRRFLVLVWPKLSHVASEKYGQNTGSFLSMYLVDLSNKIYSKEFDILLIGMLLGIETTAKVAIYSLSFVLVTRVFSFLGLGTANSAALIMNFVAELDAEGKKLQIAKFVTKQIKLIVFFVLPIMVGGVVLGGKVLHIMYKGDLHEYSVINGLFFIGYSISALTYVSKPVLFVLGSEKRLLNIRAVFSLIKVLLLLVLIPMLGILGAALVTTLILIISSLAEYHLLNQCIRVEIPFKFLRKMIISNVTMFSVAFFSSKMFDKAVPIDVSVVVALSVAVYSVALIALKPIDEEDYHYICNLGFIKKIRIDQLLFRFTDFPKLKVKS